MNWTTSISDVTLVEVYRSNGGDNTVSYNGNASINFPSGTWTTVYDNSSLITLTALQIIGVSSGQPGLAAVRVNGLLLVDLSLIHI